MAACERAFAWTGAWTIAAPRRRPGRVSKRGDPCARSWGCLVILKQGSGPLIPVRISSKKVGLGRFRRGMTFVCLFGSLNSLEEAGWFQLMGLPRSKAPFKTPVPKICTPCWSQWCTGPKNSSSARTVVPCASWSFLCSRRRFLHIPTRFIRFLFSSLNASPRTIASCRKPVPAA